MSIDEITAAFFEAFTTDGHEAPKIDVLYDLFLPSATIVKANFKEYETSATTDTFGNIAQRFSRYEKTWVVSGVERRGGGAKSIQFVRTPSGWKIAALVWDDAE